MQGQAVFDLQLGKIIVPTFHRDFIVDWLMLGKI